jgi:hypothetical protein
LSNPNQFAISGAVEGIVDEAVLRALLRHVNILAGSVYGKKGRDHLHKQINGYNNAARFSPWLVIVDLNHNECAPSMRASWLPNPASRMCFRIAVREIEAWLLADRNSLARFLSVPLRRMPQQPDQLDDPKGALVDLARLSRRRDIRTDMVPTTGSHRVVGPAYPSRLIEFAEERWDVTAATQVSDSLARCIASLRTLAC